MKWSLGLKGDAHKIAEQLFDLNSSEAPIRKAWDVHDLDEYGEEGWLDSL